MAIAAPFSLVGRSVQLVPLGPAHVDALAAAAAIDRSTFGWTAVPDGRDATDRYVRALLAAADRREVQPFVQVRSSDGVPVGCTRLMEPRSWRGRGLPDEIEIGGTWLAADAQRTAINSEAKLLLLTHVFETWGVVRACLCTDARNERSRRAIERLGARFEGVLANHRPSYVAGEEGRPRDSALFSITDDRWPEVKDGLLRATQVV